MFLLSLCAVFSPPCAEMVKEYEKLYDTFIKETVVDEIYVLSMNDSFVMDNGSGNEDQET